MNRIIYIIITVFLLSYAMKAQNNMDNQNKSDTLIVSLIDINEILKLKENNKHQYNLLIEFKNKYQKDDNISVEEYQSYYKLIVDHADENNFTGGAECYKLDKKTGETEMIWHEEPVKLFVLEQIDSCNQTSKQPKQKVTIEKVTSILNGTFNHYQVNTMTGVGIGGKLFLNDTLIQEFKPFGSTLSYNVPKTLIKKGTNQFHLELHSIAGRVEAVGWGSKAYISIKLHGLNEPGFANDGNLVVNIEWFKTMEKNIIYEFTQGIE